MSAAVRWEYEELAASWLTEHEQRRLVQRALCDVFKMESPIGSNRSPTIDRYNLKYGAQLGDPYCASSQSAWWDDCGYEIPPMDPAWWAQHTNRAGKPLPYLPPCSCDAWRLWALLTNRFATTPEPGSAVLYGTHDDATHIGMIIRVTPLLMTFEANTSADGKFNREGFCFDRKFIERTSTRVIGYVRPRPLAA